MMTDRSQALKVTWSDSGLEPQCAPNPDYPDGKDMDFTHGEAKFCETALPYPAKRIGAFIIECPRCGIRVVCTTAGRPDDPRSAKVPCFAQRLVETP